MTQKQARETLRRTGKLRYAGFVVWERLSMRSNWQEYTGMYRAAPVGMEEDAIDVRSIAGVIRIIKKGVAAFPLGSCIEISA